MSATAALVETNKTCVAARAQETASRMPNKANHAELEQLARKAIAGDARLYEALLLELTRRLRPFFMARLANRADAEDLVQETLIAVHERRSSFNPAQPFTAWVYAIARYKLIDHLRRQRVRAHVPIDDVEGLFALDRTDAGDAGRDVATLLDQLPEQQRTALSLTRIGEQTTREAAAASGLSESSIRVNAHRGLKRLIALVRGSVTP
jgi:RNA polymerase sigma-70 factor, ECF subfamily